jgi:hypothetical protein
MYYPTRVGTMRGQDCTPQERQKWPASERQRFRNVQALFDAGTDPYAVLLAEAKQRGQEALLTFRMNDAHGNDFLRTAFWREHPGYRLSNGALDFQHDAVREHVFGKPVWWTQREFLITVGLQLSVPAGSLARRPVVLPVQSTRRLNCSLTFPSGWHDRRVESVKSFSTPHLPPCLPPGES